MEDGKNGKDHVSVKVMQKYSMAGVALVPLR